MHFWKYIWPVSFKVRSVPGGIVRAIVYVLCLFLYQVLSMYTGFQESFPSYHQILTVAILIYIVVGIGLVVMQMLFPSRRRRHRRRSDTSHTGTDVSSMLIPPMESREPTSEEYDFRNTSSSEGHRDDAVVLFKPTTKKGTRVHITPQITNPDVSSTETAETAQTEENT